MLTSRHVIVGGGGGSSKTGVANGFVSNFTGQSNYTLAIYTFAGFHFDLNKHRGYVISLFSFKSSVQIAQFSKG